MKRAVEEKPCLRPWIREPQLECLRREALQELQSGRLRSAVRKAYDSVPFYSERLRKAGINAGDDIRSVEDVRCLPFTTKDDLRAHYPFGLLAVPREQIVRIHASSGTTGKPTIAAYTQKDLDLWAQLTARALAASGVNRGTVIHNAYGYGLFTGGLGFQAGAELLGALVVPVSAGQVAKQLLFLRDFKPQMLLCTPSFAAHLVSYCEAQGENIAESALEAGIFGGEPWSESLRGWLQRKIGLVAHDTYGLSELIGPGVAHECAERAGAHINEDHFLVEIVDFESESVLPEGEEGEVVVTCLTRDGVALLRYRTGDCARMTTAPCRCGRTSARLSKVLGRWKDRFYAASGKAPLFPAQIEDKVLTVPGTEPHYQIHLHRDGPMELQIEISNQAQQLQQTERIRADIEKILWESFSLTSSVRVMLPGSLPRSEGKALRVIKTFNDRCLACARQGLSR